jgi:unsaturated rhamnogalacturonyl hydrolase
VTVTKSAIALLVSMLVLCRIGAAAEPGAPTPEAVGELLSRNLLARDHMLYGDEALHYSEAAAAVGALRFAQVTGDDALRDRLVSRYAALLDDDSGLVSRRAHVDMRVIGIVPLQIAILTGDARFLRQGLTFADSQWAAPRDDGLTSESRFWIDDLYMVGMLQIQAYRATGDAIYADRAARQLAAYLPALQQASGLFYHSPDAPIFWGRGNGWVAAAMAEVLASLPADQPDRPVILASYRTMMHALLRYQNDAGLWRQVIDLDSAWGESSGTAMIAYAMAAGIDRGLLPEGDYRPAVDAAWRGLTALIDEDGNVGGVCVGTGKKNDLQYYLDRPRVAGDFHGQAPVLWLAAELLRAGFYRRDPGN